MSKGFNRVIIVGNLGKDPESKSLPSGDCVTNFSVATGESWKDKSGEKQERTEWHKICMFGRLAEVASKYLRKGSKVLIEGSLRTNKWTDTDGKDRYSTEIIGSSLQMLDAKGSNENDQQAPIVENQKFDSKVSQETEEDNEVPF